jgi:uncharacterized damage-inducible protein DinB
MTSVSSKQTFLRVWDREFRTTMNVFRSFPDAALEAKPHERSRSARELVWQCVTGERVIASIVEKLVHDLRNAPPSLPAPETMQEIAAAYETAHRDAVRKVDSLTEEDFGRTVTSILNGGDRRSGHGFEWSMPQPDALWANVMDQVHHRGQLTIYLRQAGGKVPSIYGPSGDQPVPAF